MTKTQRESSGYPDPLHWAEIFGQNARPCIWTKDKTLACRYGLILSRN